MHQIKRKLNLRGTRSPSKFLSLKYLENIRQNDYCNRDKGIDYDPNEVDILIYQKQTKKDQEKMTRDEIEYSRFYTFDQKQRRVKTCTKCLIEKPFDQFHKANCKKTFGLRSHCKECRSEKNPF